MFGGPDHDRLLIEKGLVARGYSTGRVNQGKEGTWALALAAAQVAAASPWMTT
jgi:hypothetical protein